MKKFVILLPSILFVRCLMAQTVSVHQAIELALQRNPSVVAASLETSRQTARKRASIEIPKSEVTWMNGQFNSIRTDNNITITQTIPFPTTLLRQNKLGKDLVTSSKLNEQVVINETRYRIKQLFNQLLYVREKAAILQEQDSLFENLLRVATTQHQTGETSVLMKTTAETQRMEIANQLDRNKSDFNTAIRALQIICQSEIDNISGRFDSLLVTVSDLSPPVYNPSQQWMRQQVEIAQRERKLEGARVLPEIKIGYFNQTLIGVQNVKGQDVFFDSGKKFDGFQLGISIPLWFMPYTARMRAGSYSEDIATKEAEANELRITQQFEETLMELLKNRQSLHYYQSSALKTASLLRHQSEVAFKAGELDYTTLLLNLRQVLMIRLEYLNTLRDYNNNLITIDYLKGN